MALATRVIGGSPLITSRPRFVAPSLRTAQPRISPSVAAARQITRVHAPLASPVSQPSLTRSCRRQTSVRVNAAAAGGAASPAKFKWGADMKNLVRRGWRLGLAHPMHVRRLRTRPPCAPDTVTIPPRRGTAVSAAADARAAAQRSAQQRARQTPCGAPARATSSCPQCCACRARHQTPADLGDRARAIAPACACAAGHLRRRGRRARAVPRASWRVCQGMVSAPARCRGAASRRCTRRRRVLVRPAAVAPPAL
jgi:hypothetical protein